VAVRTLDSPRVRLGANAKQPPALLLGAKKREEDDRAAAIH
jgi:hypothetical protein